MGKRGEYTHLEIPFDDGSRSGRSEGNTLALYMGNDG
jgi:hypothetical protein